MAEFVKGVDALVGGCYAGAPVLLSAPQVDRLIPERVKELDKKTVTQQLNSVPACDNKGICVDWAPAHVIDPLP